MFKLIPGWRVKLLVEDLLPITCENTRHFSSIASILVPIHVSYNVPRFKTNRVRAVTRLESETVRVHPRGFAEARNMISRRLQKFLVKDCTQPSPRDCYQTKRQDRKQVLWKVSRWFCIKAPRPNSSYTTPIFRTSISNNKEKKQNGKVSGLHRRDNKPRVNVRNFREKTLVQQIKKNNYSTW